MRKNIRYNSIRLFFIFFAFLPYAIFAAGQQINDINSSNQPVNLSFWKISKDCAPNEKLVIPSDSMWFTLAPIINNIKIDEGNWLLKAKILLRNDTGSHYPVLGLFPKNFISAFEIYWDGVKIAQNGNIGINQDFEKAGNFSYYLPVPPHLTKAGEHVIILRISNHNKHSIWKWYFGDLGIGSYDLGLKKIYQTGYMSFLVTGILVIPFLFNLFLYIARKRKVENLLFSLICLAVILDYAAYQAPVFISLPTTYIYFEVYAFYFITLLFGILLPVYFIYSFSFSNKLIPGVIIIEFSVFFFLTNMWNVFNVMNISVMIITSGISLWALFKRREGSIIISGGLLTAWACYFLGYGFSGLATIMVLCTSLSIARQFSKTEKNEREAQLRSIRLENELLRKNISPHFLLNTLTSIIVWLRKEPALAIKLIEALAEEFRMILQVTDLKLIPIEQEITLCNVHLNVMNFRKGGNYKMEHIDIVPEEKIPPMMFHTLIENGLSHGYEDKLDGTFTLQRKSGTNSIIYILSNDGDFSGRVKSKSTGFGQRYIEARLEESFPGRWEFISQKSDNGWENIIEIRNI